jgi:endonuclease/exonuclease/phosphatase family metal-dependent hydrolase
LKIRIASYNVHEYVGTDGQRSAQRILQVLRALRADVLLLQEIHNTSNENNEPVVDWFARELGMHAFLDPTLLRDEADYGNACLVKHIPNDWQRHDLSVPGREPRGAIELCFGAAYGWLRIITTHLGLRRRERRRQLATLRDILAARPAPVTVLGGDFNEMPPVPHFIDSMPGQWSRQRVSTFPSRWPLLSLDRVHVQPPDRLDQLRVERSRLTRVASDHLPLVADIVVACDSGLDPAA